MELREKETERIRNYFRGLLDELCEFDGFEEILKSGNKYDYHDFRNCYGTEFFVGTYGNVSISAGATRLTVIPEDYPYVMKINFNYGDAGEELTMDYNQEEAVNYSFICGRFPEVVEAFPFTTHMMIRGLRVVIQEKVECDEDEVVSSYPSLWEDCSDEAIKELFNEIYGPRFEDALDYCYINDLHTGNIGLKNGKLVLFDFAGYQE